MTVRLEISDILMRKQELYESRDAKWIKIMWIIVNQIWTIWVVLCVKDFPDCTKLQQESWDQGSLWVSSTGDSPTGDGAASHSTDDQEEPVNGTFYRQMAELPFLEALIIMEVCNHPGTCWKGNTALSRKSRSFLHCASDNFIMAGGVSQGLHSTWLASGECGHSISLGLPSTTIIKFRI